MNYSDYIYAFLFAAFIVAVVWSLIRNRNKNESFFHEQWAKEEDTDQAEEAPVKEELPDDFIFVEYRGSLIYMRRWEKSTYWDKMNRQDKKNHFDAVNKEVKSGKVKIENIDGLNLYVPVGRKFKETQESYVDFKKLGGNAE